MKVQGQAKVQRQQPLVDKKWSRDSKIALFALLTSVVSLIASVYAVIQPGTVRPVQPSGYAIIREVGSTPSDHIVVPLEWENTSGQPVLIRQPYLRFRELDSNGQETGKEYKFLLAGEYPEISQTAFENQYIYKNSFTIEPRSISLKVLVFHNDRWYDQSSDLYRFRFKTGQRYAVYIGYQKNLNNFTESSPFQLPIYNEADKLDRATSLWWTYWYLIQ